MNAATRRLAKPSSFPGSGQPSRARHSSVTMLLAGALAVCLLASTAGCTRPQVEETDTIKAIATILPLADFVQQVGSDRVNVTVMVPPGASPHVHEPTPGQMVDVSNADICVKTGSGVEFELTWLDKLTEQNRDMPIIDCSAGIAILDNDPHIWNSPENAKMMARNIAEGLAAIDPAHAEFYRDNAAEYAATLDELDRDIRELLGPFSNRHFMMYHPSFGYFARDYDLVQLAIEHDGKSPTPQVMQGCIDQAAQYSLQFVFVAPQFAAADAKAVADAIGGETAIADPLPSAYEANMRSVANEIARELE